MHEVSLVADLVEHCAAQAAGRQVQMVVVRHATSIPEDGLRQAFTMLTEEGPLKGAILETESVATTLDCKCGFNGAVGHDEVVGHSIICPKCGNISEHPNPHELELLRIVALKNDN